MRLLGGNGNCRSQPASATTVSLSLSCSSEALLTILLLFATSTASVLGIQIRADHDDHRPASRVQTSSFNVLYYGVVDK